MLSFHAELHATPFDYYQFRLNCTLTNTDEERQTVCDARFRRQPTSEEFATAVQKALRKIKKKIKEPKK